jgi:hypothetical protein
MRIDPRTRTAPVAFDFAFGRPIVRRIRRRLTRRGIDTAFEQLIELRMESPSAHAAPREQIPIECVKVPEIKNESVTLCYRALIEGARRNQPEERVRLITSMRQFPAQSVNMS